MMFCKFALFSFKHYGYQLSIGEQSLKQPKKGEKQKKKMSWSDDITWTVH